MIQVSKERDSHIYRMHTVDGREVYHLGPRGFTLEAAEHRLKHQCFDGEVYSAYSQKRLERAEAALGVKCEWRSAGWTQCMDVAF